MAESVLCSPSTSEGLHPSNLPAFRFAQTLFFTMKETYPIVTQADNDADFVRDCRAFNDGKTSVNPYVSNMTCYGVKYSRVKSLLTANGVHHPVYNP